MLEGDGGDSLINPDNRARGEAWEDLECKIQVPRTWLAYFQKQGAVPTVMNDLRRFPRYYYHERAVLHYRQTLPAVRRTEERHLVLTRDVSRGGVCFLHAQQLFPRERMTLEMSGGRHVGIEIVRCRKHNDHCFEIGGSFIKQPCEDAGDPTG